MKATTTLLALPLLFTVGTSAFAQIITGNPATDAGWISEGLSTSPGNFMLNTVNGGSFSANVYATAFTLTAGSTLLGTGGVADGWAAGDTIVGVGGVFTSTGNSSLTYSGTTGDANLHLAVKYGAPTSLWTVSGTGLTANQAASLSFGGTGAVLLGTSPLTIGPTTGIVTTADAPTLYNGSGQVPLGAGHGVEGQVLTTWTGTALSGFESFLDLNVLAADAPTANVQLGDQFVLDLQQGTSSTVIQVSLGALPTEVPEPTMLVSGALLLAPFASRLLRRKQKA